MRLSGGMRIHRLNGFPAAAAELVRLNVDVILAAGGEPTRAAKQVTTTIPIVMGQGGDPVAAGFVASLARPGGNITGLRSRRGHARRQATRASPRGRSQYLSRGRADPPWRTSVRAHAAGGPGRRARIDRAA